VIKSKLKKAFCEPGNVDFCPPIALAEALIWDSAKSAAPSPASSTQDGADTTAVNVSPRLVISRPLEHGGDKEYTSADDLRADFVQGEGTLHPGDLKNGVSTVMVDVMTRVIDAIKNDKAVFQASKVLKDFKKKQAKSKK
jgi:hypothetical protein